MLDSQDFLVRSCVDEDETDSDLDISVSVSDGALLKYAESKEVLECSFFGVDGSATGFLLNSKFNDFFIK